ncbi:hypothetical protein ID866_9002 [Astraeus odoratus]|nr:hypothetical protein ID866_9002 [Astraeus odoratus]
MEHDSVPLLAPEPLKAQGQWAKGLETSLDAILEDDEETATLHDKAKSDHVKEKSAERKWRCDEEWKAHEEAEKKVEEAWKVEEAKWRAEKAENAAEVQRRGMEKQWVPSEVTVAEGSVYRSTNEPPMGSRDPCDRCVNWWPPHKCKLGKVKGKSTACKPCHKAKASCTWTKTARGGPCKQRRTQVKEGNRNNNDDNDNVEGLGEVEDDFTVLAHLTEEYGDMLGTLMTTLSALLKEFKGYHCKQWDLQACQVRGLKALQMEMRKANTLKANELGVISKGKEKAAELESSSSESSNKEEDIEDKDSNGGRDVEKGVC